MTCVVNTGGWYPWVICHAVAMVDELEVFRALPDSYGTVLRRLIKKVGKDDGQRPIYARRHTLAEETGKSVETIYRALREFESKGWIEEREKRAGVGLRGSDSEITFTKALCDLLELPYEGKKARVKRESKPPVIDGSSNNAIAIGFSIKQSPSEKHPSEFPKKPKLSTGTQEEGEKVVRIDGKSVPKELAWLIIEQDLSLPGLFALMRQAKKNGKVLSDVVECVAQHLKKLDGRNVFAYLNALVMKNRDFAWEIRQRREQVEQNKLKQKEVQRLWTAAGELNGKWFISKVSGAVFTVERDWIRMFSFDDSGRVQEGSKPLNTAFLDAVEDGELRPCDAGSTPVRFESDKD